MPESPIPKETLEATLRQAAQGHEDAWRVIVEAYAPRVYGLLRAQCGSTDLAEEITQSTFCTIVAKIGGYTEVGRFESWLFRIAMNRLRDEMRRRKRQAMSVEEPILTGLIGAGATPEPGPDEDLVRRLHAGLARLSEADQRIIHLRHVAGLSFKQIADLLEQPLGTVLARQHRALKKLADYVSGGVEE
jgi:RNA polymerase sigma-70 factor (ECF subfamily)